MDLSQELQFKVLVEVLQKVQATFEPPIADDPRLIVQILDYLLGDFLGDLLFFCNQLGLFFFADEESLPVFLLCKELGDEADCKGVKPDSKHHPKDRDDSLERVGRIEVSIAHSGEHHRRVVERRQIDFLVRIESDGVSVAVDPVLRKLVRLSNDHKKTRKDVKTEISNDHDRYNAKEVVADFNLVTNAVGQAD